MQLRWLRRRTREIDGEALCDDLDISWRVLEAQTPCNKNAFDSIRIYLGGEAVELRANFAQRCIERPLGNVLRLQMEGRRRGSPLWSRGHDPRESSPQACRNEGSAGRLTEPGKEVAPAEFQSKTPLCQAQRDFSSEVTCRAKLTFARKWGQAG